MAELQSHEPSTLGHTPPAPRFGLPEAQARRAGAPLGRLALILAALFLIGALAGFIPRWRRREFLKIQASELSRPTVAVASPTLEHPAADLMLPAEVAPYIEAPIYARASGYLKKWLVDIGARVKAGQLLAEIDTPDLDQELAQARAALAEAQAAVELAKSTAARWTELLKTASVSEQETAEKKSDLAYKAATVEAARANVRRLEYLKSFAQVAAPFDGTITDRKIDIGDLINAGGKQELFRLAQTSTLRIYVEAPQSVAADMAPGQTADLIVPELPGRRFAAKLVRTAGAITPDTRTLRIELDLDNSKGEILAGSFAQVEFPRANQTPALTVPSTSLIFRAQGAQLGVVRPDGRIELRSVTVGRDFGARLEILFGVTASDRVILNPPDSIINGQMARVAPAVSE